MLADVLIQTVSLPTCTLAAPTAAAAAGSSSEDKGVTLLCASVILQLSVQLHLINVISNYITTTAEKQAYRIE